MPGLATAPPHGQPATEFTFADLAAADNDDVEDLKERVEELAGRQLLEVKPDWIDTASFVLADRSQVESHEWCSLWKPAVVISCVGVDTKPFRYGFEPSDDVVAPEIPICYWKTREAKLKLCLWDIVAALSQGR